jgi:DNA-binding CsgD family transcriptional regulator
MGCSRAASLIRGITNSVGSTGAIPTGQMRRPLSMSSRVIVVRSQRTKNASSGVVPATAPSAGRSSGSSRRCVTRAHSILRCSRPYSLRWPAGEMPVFGRRRIGGADYDGPVQGAAELDTVALLRQAQEAVRAGEWSAARSRFEAVLAQEESPEALFGLGNVLWWLGETEASVRCQERAYAAFRRRGDPGRAVLTAIYLCLTYRASLGNFAASRGWLGRAASLVEEDAASMSGWVLLGRAVVAADSGDPRSAESWAREAREVAREAGDTDLWLCAVSLLGEALVETGRVEEGASLLDEAMAGALSGEADNLDTVVLTSCRTIMSCSRGGEVSRATQWIRAADDFNRRYGSPHLYTTCRIHSGSILVAAGEWERAEEELRAALRIGKAAEPALHAEALAKLAELRLAQGRTEEAARLLSGYEAHRAAALAVATLRLAQGEAALASSILRRRLRELDEDSLEGAAVLELLAETEIARDAVEEAAALAGRLEEFGSSSGSGLMTARGERAVGRAMLATGGPGTAIRHLERALTTFGHLEMPLELGRTRLLLARALAEAGREIAIAEARGALEGFEELGAARDADAAAAFLRSLGVKAARSGPRGIGVLTKREREVLELLGEGLSNPEIAKRLYLSRKTVQHHVARVLAKLELRGRGEAAAYAVRELSRNRDSASK